DIVALFISDQKMPGMQGVEFLEAIKEYYPDAKKILLTAYSDINAAIKAINDVQLDYYLMKPWDPPEEKLYPIINEILDDWQIYFKPEFHGIKLIGYQWTKHSHTIKDFLAGNLIPYLWLNIELDEEAKSLIKLGNIECKDLPALFFEDGTILKRPSLTELANKIGLKSTASQKLYDVTIIGAGPAGLAAAVYGASEGLRTLLIDRRAPGGQAGTSSRIENYLGFPTGISGSELTRRAITQAERLGAEFLTPVEVVEINLKETYKSIILSDGTEIKTLSIIIATGVDYARLQTKGIEELTGAGIYYGAATTEANACSQEDVYIVGGGNSAGQAAMYLSKFAKNVSILIRRDSLKYTMSQYLIEQIEATSNIQLLTKAAITEVTGEKQLEYINLSIEGKENVKLSAKSLFIFIGTRPYT
ncbi:response regulator, partial [bacterium]